MFRSAREVAITYSVRPARIGDVSAMTRLIERRRAEYEQVQPVFWKRSGGSAARTRWFYSSLLLLARRTLILVADDDGHLLGFLIARPVRNPPVYNPDGPTVVIDDFCVAGPEQWPVIGRALLERTRAIARKTGWRQIVVVCGAGDKPKAAFLQSAELSIVTNWWRETV